MAQATHDHISILRASLARIGRVDVPDGRFRVRDLSVLAYAQGTTWWAFRGLRDAGLPASQAPAPGYFDDAQGILSHGDLIWVPGEDDALQLAVLGVRDGHVVVRPMMAAATALPCAA
jgi:hypothetical protein